jgi:hypothetical protein
MRHGSLDELDALGWVVRLAKSLAAIHATGAAHGRVSAECILLSDPSPKSKGVLASTSALRGDIAFQCPERVAGAPPSMADDTWALAVILYLALTGRLPFLISDDVVRHDERPPRLWEFLERSDALQEILDRSFAIDASGRIRTTDALREALEDCFEDKGLEALPPLEQAEEPVPAAGVLERGADVTAETAKRASPQSDASAKGAMGEAPLGPLSSGPREKLELCAVEPAPRATQQPRSEARLEPSAADQTSSLLRGGRGRGMTKALLLAFAAVGAGVLAFIALRDAGRRGAEFEEGNTLSAAQASTDTGAGPSPSAPASAAVGASGSKADQASTAPGQAAPAGDVTACIQPLFANNTFGHGVDVDFGFVCAETDPRRGSTQVVSAIVRAAANRMVSDGMREWGMLGWHDMAAFAVMRARCCPSARPLLLPASKSTCPSMASALNELATVATSAIRIDDPSLRRAVHRYTETVTCIVKNDATQFYKRHGPPHDSEAATLQKTLVRVLGSPKK